MPSAGTLPQSIISSSLSSLSAEGLISKVCGTRREKATPGLAASTIARLRCASLSEEDGPMPFGIGDGVKTIGHFAVEDTRCRTCRLAELPTKAAVGQRRLTRQRAPRWP